MRHVTVFILCVYIIIFPDHLNFPLHNKTFSFPNPQTRKTVASRASASWTPARPRVEMPRMADPTGTIGRGESRTTTVRAGEEARVDVPLDRARDVPGEAEVDVEDVVVAALEEGVERGSSRGSRAMREREFSYEN